MFWYSEPQQETGDIPPPLALMMFELPSMNMKNPVGAGNAHQLFHLHHLLIFQLNDHYMYIREGFV